MTCDDGVAIGCGGGLLVGIKPVLGEDSAGDRFGGAGNGSRDMALSNAIVLMMWGPLF